MKYRERLAPSWMGVVVLAMMLTGVMEVVLGRHEGPVLAAMQRELTTPQGQVNGFVNLFNFVTVVGAMAIVRLSRQRRMHEDRAAELETQVARAHLRALEMQINPHFLFNALNGIASLVQQKRDGDAFRAITLLGGLLRETIDGTERKLIPLQQELAFLERYLELEHMRFSDRLRVSVRADQDCRDVIQIQPIFGMALDTLVPMIDSRIAAKYSAFERLSTERTLIDGHDAYRVECRYVKEDGPEQASLVFTKLDDNHLLSFVYLAAPDDFDRLRSDFEAIERSIRLESATLSGTDDTIPDRAVPLGTVGPK